MPPLYDRNAQSDGLLLDADDLLSIGSGFPQDALLLPNDADQHFAVPLPLALDGTHFVEGDDDDNLSLGAVEEGYNRSSPEGYDYEADDSIIDEYSTSSDNSGDAEKPSRPNRLRRTSTALVLIAFLAVVAALLAPAVLSYRNNTQRLQKQNEISTLRQLIVDEFDRHDNDADGTDTTKSKLHVLFNGGFERVWNELSVEQQYDWLDAVQNARRDVEEKEKKRQERRRERQRRRDEEKEQAQSKGDKVVTSNEHLNHHKKKKRRAKEV